MGRTQAFDTGQVVSAARNLFWKKGFDAVSVADVQAATGLSRSSIYHAFGSMRGLFDAAVADYLDNVVRPRLVPISGDRVDRHALAQYLNGLAEVIERLGDHGEPTGCLLVGTSATTLSDDPAVRQVMADYQAELLAAVTRGLRARYPRASEETIAARATGITGSVIAANVLARINRAEAVRLIRLTAADLEPNRARSDGLPQREALG